MKDFTIKESYEWLQNKCEELGLNSIEALEEFNEKQTDINLQEEIYLHLDNFSEGVCEYMVSSHFISSYKMEIISKDKRKSVQLEKRFIKNLNKFELESGDRGSLIILDNHNIEIITKI